MSAIRAVLLAVAATTASLFLSAIALAILGIYLSGHGKRPWTGIEVIANGPFALNLADLIVLASAGCVLVIVDVLARRSG
jgi:hypothetical protein